MTDAEYVFHKTNRERKINGYGDRHKKRRGGKSVRLQSDCLSRKEWEEMNGEVEEYALDEPKTYKEYQELPDHIKVEYLQHVLEKYNPSASMMASMFGVHRQTVYREYARQNIECKGRKGKRGKEAIREWEAFLNKRYTVTATKFEETIDIIELVKMLRGSGAKLTIEITL